MALAIVYPTTLPSPAEAPYTPSERRLLQEGPFDARAFELDCGATQDLVWPLLNGTQAAALRHWIDDYLQGGGLWFAAPLWPVPSGSTIVARHFMGPAHWDFVAGGYWRVSASFWCRGAGLPPVIYPPPDLGLHMNGGLVDTSGRAITHTGPSIDTYAPNSVAGLFGRRALSFSGYQASYLSHRGAFNLNAAGEFQISGWVNFDGSYALGAGGVLLTLIAEATSGSGFPGPGAPPGDLSQFALRFNGTGATKSIQFIYGYWDVDTHAYGSKNLQDFVPGSPVYLNATGWNFFAFCQDALGLRGYINTQQAYTDAENGVRGPGHTPMAGSALDGGQFTNQTYWFGNAFAGGYDGTVWPSGVVSSAWFGGQAQDLRVVAGIGAVDYHGTTITPPSSPFRPGKP